MKFAIGIALFSGAWLSSIEAAPVPRVEVWDEEKVVATLGQLRGNFQVRADKSQFDSSTRTMNLSGNVALTAKDESGRLFTLRAAKVSVQNADLELQIEDKTYVPEWRSWINRLEHDGHIAGVPESALVKAVRQHPNVSAHRLRYHGVGAGSGTTGMVLWNRRTKILRTYSILNYPEPGILNIVDITFRAVDEARLLSLLEPQDTKSHEVSFENLKRFNQFTDASRRFRFPVKR